MRRRKEKIDLESGGVISVGFEAYPEWGKVFEAVPSRCDRCWESKGSYSKKWRSDKWLCEACRFRYTNTSSLSDIEVFKRKFKLRAKRFMWNLTHENKIPDQPGHS